MTNIDVIDYPDAKMRFLINTLEVGKEYSIDDIIEVFDCKGTKRIKTNIDIQPKKSISYDRTNEKLIVMSPSEIKFNITFVDKISGKNFNFNQSILCVNNTKVEVKTLKAGFIHSIISLDNTSIIDDDLSSFINQFNSSYINNSYKLLRVASIRTLLEIISCDILDALKEDKSEYLKENIKKVFSEKIIKNNLFNKIIDDRDKKALKSIYDLNKQDLISGKFTDKYNFSTHGLTRIVNDDFYMEDQPIFNLLYSYLLFVSSK